MKGYRNLSKLSTEAGVTLIYARDPAPHKNGRADAWNQRMDAPQEGIRGRYRQREDRREAAYPRE